MDQFPALLRAKDRQPIRYLVVDDSVFARKNLLRILETFGGQVAGEAGDGCTAITEYDRTQPDIVLMDITMPQMEGIEAAEPIVRQHPDDASSWFRPSDTRKTLLRLCKKAHVTSFRSRSNPNFSTKSSSTCSAKTQHTLRKRRDRWRFRPMKMN